MSQFILNPKGVVLSSNHTPSGALIPDALIIVRPKLAIDLGAKKSETYHA